MTLSMKSRKALINAIVLPFAAICTINACTPDAKLLASMDDREKTATITAKNSEIIYTENGLVKLKVIAPITKSYQNVEQPYIEFPEGITVYTYTDSMVLESQLTAKYANYYEKKGLWSASNNVIARNEKGEILNTEHLYWDEKKKTIYTDDMVKITTADGIQYGEGLVSDETFNNWEIKKPKSLYYIEDK